MTDWLADWSGGSGRPRTTRLPPANRAVNPTLVRTPVHSPPPYFALARFFPLPLAAFPLPSSLAFRHPALASLSLSLSRPRFVFSSVGPSGKGRRGEAEGVAAVRESFAVMKNAFLCVADFARRPGDAIDSIITGGDSEAPLPPGASPAHPTRALLDSVHWLIFFLLKNIFAVASTTAASERRPNLCFPKNSRPLYK